MKKIDIAKAFSNGDFEICFPYLTNSASWEIIEENKLEGRDSIINYCRDVAAHFKTVTTNFKTLLVIEDNNQIAITGTAEFLRDKKTVSFVYGCDIYLFNNENQLESILSYCIKKK